MKVVVGLGVTGLSCVEYLLGQGEQVIAMDEASTSKNITLLQDKYPEVGCVLGRLDAAVLLQAQEIILSPGISIHQPELVACQKAGISLIGDIELFARAAQAPIYAITGSNGKTTVTTLLGLMAEAAEMPLKVAGNIGQPVLSLLSDNSIEGYILELSSFQLETTHSLKAQAAVLLNVTPDHMDRYRDFDHYCQSKQRIYHQCHTAIVNLDESELWTSRVDQSNVVSFSVECCDADFYVAAEGGQRYLFKRGTRLLNLNDMQLKGQHHEQNALAALALAEQAQIPLPACLSVLKVFTGLAHRCQQVAIKNKVTWYNDSKATNVGATVTAINSLGSGQSGRLILLAGGLAKGAEFSALGQCVAEHVSDVILLGQDANLLAGALSSSATLHFAASLEEAVKMAAVMSKPSDQVLFSPACASFDMFANFADRGNQFMACVERL